MKQDFSPPLTLFFRQGTMTNVPVTRCIRGKKSVKLTKTKLLRPRLGGFFGFFEFFFCFNLSEFNPLRCPVEQKILSTHGRERQGGGKDKRDEK